MNLPLLYKSVSDSLDFVVRLDAWELAVNIKAKINSTIIII